MKQITTENAHSASGYGHPVGIMCECGHRALIPVARIGHRGDMAYLRDLKLTCRECGSRQWKGFLFVGPLQVEAFNAGSSLADVFDLRYAHLAKDDPRIVFGSSVHNPYREAPRSA